VRLRKPFYLGNCGVYISGKQEAVLREIAQEETPQLIRHDTHPDRSSLPGTSSVTKISPATPALISKKGNLEDAITPGESFPEVANTGLPVVRRS
jgi:hypothetical protein